MAGKMSSGTHPELQQMTYEAVLRELKGARGSHAQLLQSVWAHRDEPDASPAEVCSEVPNIPKEQQSVHLSRLRVQTFETSYKLDPAECPYILCVGQTQIRPVFYVRPFPGFHIPRNLLEYYERPQEKGGHLVPYSELIIYLEEGRSLYRAGLKKVIRENLHAGIRYRYFIPISSIDGVPDMLSQLLPPEESAEALMKDIRAFSETLEVNILPEETPVPCSIHNAASREAIVFAHVYPDRDLIAISSGPAAMNHAKRLLRQWKPQVREHVDTTSVVLPCAGVCLNEALPQLRKKLTLRLKRYRLSEEDTRKALAVLLPSCPEGPR